MAAPNTALRAVRISRRLSQDEFARLLRSAGAPTVTKKTVQRWEWGETRSPQARLARALEAVTGLPIAVLGFDAPVPDARVHDDGRGGHDVHHPVDLSAMRTDPPTGPGPRGSYSGVWLSRYEYYSSGRSETFLGQHYVVVLQHGDQLTVRSIPGSSDSTMTMTLSVEGSVITGTWMEQTDPASYYRGARYHGAIQMLADPTGRRIVGKWVGFGKEMDINTGPWELTFQDASTSRATIERYSQPPSVD